MIALNITRSLRGELEGHHGGVRACAERWWGIADSTLDGYADLVLAVAENVIAGVFEVRGWRRDADVDGKVVFDLAEAAGWQHLTGQDSPITWRKSQANPVRKVRGVIRDQLRAGLPTHEDAGHGWSLDVDPSGTSVTVRGPGAVVVTALHGRAAGLALIPAPDMRALPRPRPVDGLRQTAGCPA